LFLFFLCLQIVMLLDAGRAVMSVLSIGIIKPL
jgi:hypothetical protein